MSHDVSNVEKDCGVTRAQREWAVGGWVLCGVGADGVIEPHFHIFHSSTRGCGLIGLFVGGLGVI